MSQPASPPIAQRGSEPVTRLGDSLSRYYLPLLLGVCAVYAWTPLMGGHDFWAHAAVGRWIAANHQVPKQSLFIWSTDPSPWVAHSWLSELFFYQMLQHGGPYAVLLFTLVLPVVIFALLWRLWSRRAAITLATPWIFVVALWCSSARFQPRQELVSALFLVLLLMYLLSDRHKTPPIVHSIGIVLMFALWVNLHALVAVGLGLLGVSAILDALQDRLDRRSRALLLVFALSFAATLFNPWGLGYWQAANQLQSSGMSAYIEEWKPFWADPPLWGAAVAEVVLMAIAVYSWAANPHRRSSQLFWVLLLGLAFAKSRRLLWLAAIVFLAVIGANAGSLNLQKAWQTWRRISGGSIDELPEPGMRLIARGGTILCLALWVVSAIGAHFGEEQRPWQAVSQRVPEAAVRYVLDHNIQGHIYNDYEHSSYLQWRFNGPDPRTGEVSSRGAHPLYIDLLNGYPDKVMHDYLQVLEASDRGLEELRRVDYVVLGRHHRKDNLVSYLNTHSDWVLVLRDENSYVWLRRIPRYRDLWQGVRLPPERKENQSPQP